MFGLGKLVGVIGRVLKWTFQSGKFMFQSGKFMVIAGRTIAVAPVVLGLNVYLFLNAMSLYRRARYMAEVRLLEQLDEEALRQLLEGLPPWVKSSEWERGRFLNEALKLLWPAIDCVASTALRDTIEEQMSLYAPPAINGIKFERFSFGGTPMSILAVKNVKGALGADQLGIVWDLDVRWAGVPDIVCRLAPRKEFKVSRKKIAGVLVMPDINLTPAMYASFTSLTVKADLRVMFSPLLPELPLVKAMKFSFTRRPEIDFDVRVAGGDLMSLPVLNTMLHNIITTEFVESMTWPRTMDINFVEDSDEEMTGVPLGVLTLEIIQARLAPRMAMLTRRQLPLNAYTVAVLDDLKGIRSDSSDRQAYNTSTVQHSTDPEWRESFEFAVYDPEHVIRLFVGHQRGISLSQYDLPLGSVDIPVQPVMSVVMTRRHRKMMGALWAVMWAGVMLCRVRRTLAMKRSNGAITATKRNQDQTEAFGDFSKLARQTLIDHMVAGTTGNNSPDKHAVHRRRINLIGKHLQKFASIIYPFSSDGEEDSMDEEALSIEGIAAALSPAGTWVRLVEDGTRSMVYAIQNKMKKIMPYWQQSAEHGELDSTGATPADGPWIWDEVIKRPLRCTGGVVSSNVKESWLEVKEWYKGDSKLTATTILEDGSPTSLGDTDSEHDDGWNTRRDSLESVESVGLYSAASEPPPSSKKGLMRRALHKVKKRGKVVLDSMGAPVKQGSSASSNGEAYPKPPVSPVKTDVTLADTLRDTMMRHTQGSATSIAQSIPHDLMVDGKGDTTGFIRFRVRYAPVMSHRPEGPGASVSDNVVTPADPAPVPSTSEVSHQRAPSTNASQPAWLRGAVSVRGMLLVRVLRTVLGDGSVGKVPVLVINLGRRNRKSKVPDSIQGGSCMWRQLFTFPMTISSSWDEISRVKLTVSQFRLKKSSAFSIIEPTTKSAFSDDQGSKSTHGDIRRAGGQMVAHTAIELQDIIRYGRLSGSWKLWSPMQDMNELREDESSGMSVGQIFMSVMWLRVSQ